MSKFNWFIGHMDKSINQIVNNLKNIDLVINVLDARCINISNNQNLLKIFKNKSILNIALKSDLADISIKKSNVFYLSTKSNNFKSKLNHIIIDYLSPKINRYKSKGLINPHFNIIVVGLPNVGKSTLINKLIGRSKLITANEPGVTKHINLVKINQLYSIYDTPGISIKKIDNDVIGYVLSLIKSINFNFDVLYEIVEFATTFYFKNYQKQISDYFDYSKTFVFADFIDHIMIKFNFIDLNKALNYLFNLYVSGKITKVNYEK